MKTIGLIGGTTWISTIDYYRNINQFTNQKLGGLHSARIILYSVNFEEFQPPSEITQWGEITGSFIKIAYTLEAAGAECIVICANTPHLVADKIQEAITIPLIHIADATANEIKLQHLKKVALLGTRITMEQDFFRKKLLANQIESIIPEKEERDFINASIFNELGKNIFDTGTKEKYLDIIKRLINRGAEGIILGCTEIPLLIKPADLDVPSFDTTIIHSQAAVQFSLG